MASFISKTVMKIMVLYSVEFWNFVMEQIKDKVTGLVKEFATSVDEDIEMLDTNGAVLKFASDAPIETVQWICKLIEKPGIFVCSCIL